MSKMLISFQMLPFLRLSDLVVFFSLVARSLSSFGGRPDPENAMHSPRTRRLTVLDTNTLKYGHESTSMQVKLYARASRPGMTTLLR